MNETVIVALLGGLFLIVNTTILVILPIIMGRLTRVKHAVATMKSDVKETKEQMVNNHGDINFRHENDSRHAETLALFDTVIKTQDQHEDLLGLLVNGYVQNRQDIDEHDREIDELENTLNPRRDNV